MTSTVGSNDTVRRKGLFAGVAYARFRGVVNMSPLLLVGVGLTDFAIGVAVTAVLAVVSFAMLLSSTGLVAVIVSGAPVALTSFSQYADLAS